MGIIQKCGMYVLSLWLLYIILFIMTIKVPICLECQLIDVSLVPRLLRKNLLPLACGILFLISLGFYAHFAHTIQGVAEGPRTIVKLEDRGADHLAFLATYVIPLVTFDVETKRQVAVLGVTLIFLGLIYVKTNLFYSSPTLAVLGFKITAVETGPTESLILISREAFTVNDDVNLKHLDQNIYFAKKSFRVTK